MKLLLDTHILLHALTEPERLSRKRRESIRRYTVLEEVLEKEPIDIATTCTGPAYQPAVAIRIAESGRVKTMLCEKPLSQRATDAEALIAACRNNGVLVAEGWKFRHHPQHLKAKQIVEGGGIGEVMHILSTFYNRFEDRRPNTSRFISSVGGGAVRWMGCYNLHHALWLFGEEPERVYAAQMPGTEVDDAASVLLTFGGGRTALVSPAITPGTRKSRRFSEPPACCGPTRPLASTLR